MIKGLHIEDVGDRPPEVRDEILIPPMSFEDELRAKIAYLEERIAILEAALKLHGI